MRKSTTTALGLVGLVAGGLLAGGAAFAQGAEGQQDRVIRVPPGAVVLVLPAGTPVDALANPVMAFPFAAMPSPVAMFREMEQAMANAQRAFANPAWATQNGVLDVAIPPTGGAYTRVVVTSVTNSHGTCTQRITYTGNGAPPKVQVSSTGDACANAGTDGATPAALPEVRTPQPRSLPRTLMVDSRSRPTPLQVAQLNN